MLSHLHSETQVELKEGALMQEEKETLVEEEGEPNTPS